MTGVRAALKSWWNLPRAPDNPGVLWWDYWLAGAVVIGAIVEGVLRPDVPLRPLSTAVGVLLGLAMIWRRPHPFVTVAVVFGLTSAFNVVTLIQPAFRVELYIMGVVLLFPYSLMRWASGKETIAGLLLVWSTYLTAIHEAADLSEVIGGAVVLAIPAILGAEVRSWSGRRRRERGQIRLKERELLARELHDTVAHHVSAIAIQAQAGKELARTDPDAALATLSVIEGEASRTLHEMRTMVGALRDGEEPELAPPRGVADLHRLADTAGDAPPVSVELIGELDNVPPAVDAALYRLAQESITNAIRHARAATRVEVKVVEQGQTVMLTVEDDGEPSLLPAEAGYGLLGMQERTRLLGGIFRAGPAPGKGWRVMAVLPKKGAAD